MIARIWGLVILAAVLLAPAASAESLRVSPEWLKDNLQLKNLLIIDTRLQSSYEIEHIPGAISFPDELTYQQRSDGGRIVEPDVMQSLLRERGLTKDSLVVVYGDGKVIDAARVFWALEVYGIKQIKVLDEELPGWVKREFPLTDKVPSVVASNYVAVVNHHRIASKFSTQLATLNPKKIVIDARPLSAYRGESSTAKRFGHIPTAINIPVHSNIEGDSNGFVFRTDAELKELYSELPMDASVILYCEIGRASATNYLALRQLGYNVANYDASWREWANDFSLPIEK